MERKPPPPTGKCFLICRQIFQDQQTKEFVLVAPLREVVPPTFPAVVDLCFFLQVTSLQGQYAFAAQLQDLEGQVIWTSNPWPPLELHDPLAVASFDVRHVKVYFPKPGCRLGPSGADPRVLSFRPGKCEVGTRD